MNAFLKASWLRVTLVLVALVGVVALGATIGFVYASGGRENTGPTLLERGLFRRGHSAIGTITTISDTTLTINTRRGRTVSVVIGDETRIERRSQKIRMSDLRVNDRVIVIGSPDPSGAIKARLISVLDSSAWVHSPDHPRNP